MATAVIKGSVLTSTQGLAGNGVDKYAAIDNPPWQFNNQGSISVWFKLTSLPASDGVTMTIYGASDVASGSTPCVTIMGITRTGGVTRLRILRRVTDGGVTQVRDGTTALSAGIWYHAVFGGNNSNSRIYLNGAEEAYVQTGLTGGWWGNMTYAGARRHMMYARWLNGGVATHTPARIASLGIWSYLLSLAEVQELYRGGRTANLAKVSFANVLSLLAWYRPGTEMSLPTMRDWYQGQNMTTTNFVAGDIVTDHPPL